MNKLLPAFILAMWLVPPANAQNSPEYQAALDAARHAAATADKANPSPASEGYAAEMRGMEAYEEATRLYRKACDDLRDAVSCHNLGNLYERGLGVLQDLSQAAEFYERALTIDPANHFAKTRLAIVRPAPAPTPTTRIAPYRDPKKLLSGPFIQGGMGFMPFATEFEWLNFCFAAEQNGVSGIDTEKIIGSLTKDGRFSSNTRGKSPEQLAEFGKNAVLNWIDFKKINPDEAQLTVESCTIHFPK